MAFLHLVSTVCGVTQHIDPQVVESLHSLPHTGRSVGTEPGSLLALTTRTRPPHPRSHSAPGAALPGPMGSMDAKAQRPQPTQDNHEEYPLHNCAQGPRSSVQTQPLPTTSLLQTAPPFPSPVPSLHRGQSQDRTSLTNLLHNLHLRVDFPRNQTCSGRSRSPTPEGEVAGSISRLQGSHCFSVSLRQAGGRMGTVVLMS